MKETTSVEAIGLSQREFLTLFLLYSLSKKENYPRAIHVELKNSFTGKVHSYDYLCKIAKQLAQSGHLSISTNKGEIIIKLLKKVKNYLSGIRIIFRRGLVK